MGKLQKEGKEPEPYKIFVLNNEKRILMQGQSMNWYLWRIEEDNEPELSPLGTYLAPHL